MINQTNELQSVLHQSAERRIELRSCSNEKRGVKKRKSHFLLSTIKHNESAIQLSDDYMSVYLQSTILVSLTELRYCQLRESPQEGIEPRAKTSDLKKNVNKCYCENNCTVSDHNRKVSLFSHYLQWSISELIYCELSVS